MIREQAYCDEDANHQLPIVVAIFVVLHFTSIFLVITCK